MTTSNDVHDSGEWSGRLTPSDVHHVLFTRAGLGRRGYDEIEVDVFLERVQQELTRLIGEKADLRDEVARLKAQLAQAGSGAKAPATDDSVNKEEAQLQAVRLLAAAQQTADTYVADAEKYSQRLTADARDNAEAMLDEAKKAARRMVEEAERLARTEASRTIEGELADAPHPTQQELEQQVAYLKTFGQVVRVQLRSYLEALLRDVEEEWGKADPGVVVGRQPAALSGSASEEGQPEAQRTVVRLTDDAAEDEQEQDAGTAEPSDAVSNGGRSSHARRKAVSSHSR